MNFIFKNKEFFKEYDFSEDYEEEAYALEKLTKDCNKYFATSQFKVGYNKKKEKCIQGVRATYYENAGLIHEPVIFNIDSKQTIINWKLMGLNLAESEKYTTKHNRPLYQIKNNICFIFHDGKEFREFLFTKKIKSPMIDSLNEIFKNLID